MSQPFTLADAAALESGAPARGATDDPSLTGGGEQGEEGKEDVHQGEDEEGGKAVQTERKDSKEGSDADLDNEEGEEESEEEEDEGEEEEIDEEVDEDPDEAAGPLKISDDVLDALPEDKRTRLEQHVAGINKRVTRAESRLAELDPLVRASEALADPNLAPQAIEWLDGELRKWHSGKGLAELAGIEPQPGPDIDTIGAAMMADYEHEADRAVVEDFLDRLKRAAPAAKAATTADPTVEALKREVEELRSTIAAREAERELASQARQAAEKFTRVFAAEAPGVKVRAADVLKAQERFPQTAKKNLEAAVRKQLKPVLERASARSKREAAETGRMPGVGKAVGSKPVELRPGEQLPYKVD